LNCKWCYTRNTKGCKKNSLHWCHLNNLHNRPGMVRKSFVLRTVISENINYYLCRCNNQKDNSIGTSRAMNCWNIHLHRQCNLLKYFDKWDKKHCILNMSNLI
jgi:hypothetical protein